MNTIKPKFQTAQPPELLEETEVSLLYKLKNGLKLRLYTGKKNRAEQLFQTTGSPDFITAFRNEFSIVAPEDDRVNEDEIIFNHSNIQYIPPCLRETAGIIEKAKKGILPDLIQPKDIKSLIHSHSNWSDGVNTIEEMAKECIIKGFEYLVISDHSKSAVYANGLSEQRISEQHRYIDELNQKMAPFKIFKSIECDILNDGKPRLF